MNVLNNRSKVLVALNFLMALSSAFSAELHSLLRSNQAGLKPHTFYVRKNATNASSRWAVINEETTKADGISTISKTSLPKNEAVVFDRIAVGYAENAAAGQEGAVNYSTTLPNALRNADLVITQNGREVVSVAIADLGKVTSPTNQNDYYHDLESLQYLVDDQPMEIEIRFPNGQSITPGTAGHSCYLEVRLKGFKTGRKQK